MREGGKEGRRKGGKEERREGDLCFILGTFFCKVGFMLTSVPVVEKG